MNHLCQFAQATYRQTPSYEYFSSSEYVDLPAHFLGMPINRPQLSEDRARCQRKNEEKENNYGHGIDSIETNVEAQQEEDNEPLSPWANSKSKQQIINLLKDETSDIRLLIGHHTANDFSNVNFKLLQKKYADNRYKASNFKANMKRLLASKLNQTGPFKPEKIEPWYTSANNVSRAY